MLWKNQGLWRTSWPSKGSLVHIPSCDYDKIWCMPRMPPILDSDRIYGPNSMVHLVSKLKGVLNSNMGFKLSHKHSDILRDSAPSPEAGSRFSSILVA